MIPIYRAKKINSDEYVEGYYWKSPETLESFIAAKDDLTKTLVHIKINQTTLAIHFTDMLDSQGNKIFASLSEDGKGGDICYVRDFSYGDLQGVARYEDNYFRIHRKGKAMGISLKCRDIKVIGIQE